MIEQNLAAFLIITAFFAGAILIAGVCVALAVMLVILVRRWAKHLITGE